MQKFVQGLKDAVKSVLCTLKKSVTFAGRANRREFWTFQLAMILLVFVEFLIMLLVGGSVLGTIFGILFLILDLLLIIPSVSVLVRRMHDVNLSGFWFWYLNPSGLGLIYVVYILGLDKATDRFVERIGKVGSPWLGWILAVLTWWAASPFALTLICLYKGTKGENDFGPESPYPCCCCKK